MDPQVKIGLMSSVPYVHAAEGRDWQRLLGIFAGGNRPVSRIHLPAYQELAPSKYLQAFHMVSMHNRALLSADTLVYPELENYPYSRFSKSRRFTRFQLLSALALDVAGMTIDLFDLNGRGIIFADGYQDMLRAVKGYLNRLNGMGVFSRPRRGVCVLTDPDAAYRLHTREGRSLEELYPHEVFWAGLLPAMGVPFYYATDPAASRGVVAVSGQYLRCLDADAIERLFADNFVLLNGDALDTLLSLGLGCLAGVAAARWMRQDTGEYTFEQAVDGPPLYGRGAGARQRRHLRVGRAAGRLPAGGGGAAVHPLFRFVPARPRPVRDGGGRARVRVPVRPLRQPAGHPAHAAQRRAAADRAARARRFRQAGRAHGAGRAVSYALLHGRRCRVALPVPGQRRAGYGGARAPARGAGRIARCASPPCLGRTGARLFGRGARRELHAAAVGRADGERAAHLEETTTQTEDAR